MCTKVILVLLVVACGPVLAQDTFEISDYADSTAVILAPELQGALVSLESGDPVAAAVELRDILRRNPQQEQACRLLASAYLRLEDIAQAIDACRQLAAIDSSNAGVLVTLGYLYQRLGDIASAEQYYKQALIHDPNAVTAYQGLGWGYLKTGRLELALDMVSETTERAPHYAPNYVLMGRALTAQGFFEDAAIAYNRAFALQNDLRERYGILLQELGLRHRLGR
ncbi:MAG: tetratricopeptide repeat protein [Candidatus Latescibacteria bacterium]|jgi:Tfp pilus assembly protein PilF|nr:tetratricopeptide repeat protein [Candidatus Latescibacterota bacterium]